MSMLTSEKHYKIEEIARRLDGSERAVSTRTAYRYLESLKEAGMAVNSDENGFYLAQYNQNTKTIKKIINFSEEETDIINSMIEELGNQGDDFSKKLRLKLFSTLNCVTSFAKDEKIDNIKEAIREKKKVTLRKYVSVSENIPKDRIVEPIKLDVVQYCVLCFDIEKRDTRLFKLNRTEQVILENNWEYEDLHSEPFKDIFRWIGTRKYNIEILLNNISRNIILEDYPESRLSIEECDYCSEFKYKLKTDVSSLLAPTNFVLSMGNNVEVLGCEEFINSIKDRLKELNSKYRIQ